MSGKYCLSLPVLHFWPKITYLAIAEHCVLSGMEVEDLISGTISFPESHLDIYNLLFNDISLFAKQYTEKYLACVANQSSG